MRLDKVNLDMEDDKGNYVLEPLVFKDIDELAIFPGQVTLNYFFHLLRINWVFGN